MSHLHGLNPVIEALMCVGTLAGGVLVIWVFEVTIGRWLRGKYRYRPPEAPEPAPRAYDASAYAQWPVDGGVV